MGKKAVRIFSGMLAALILLALPGPVCAMALWPGVYPNVVVPDEALSDYYRWAGHYTQGGSYGGGAGRPDKDKETYDNFVASLPSTGFTSRGTFLWQPSVKDVSGSYSYYYATPYATDFHPMERLPYGVSELADGTGYKLEMSYSNVTSAALNGLGWKVVVKLPIAGLYKIVVTTKAHGRLFYRDGTATTYVEDWTQTGFVYHSAGDHLFVGADRFFVSAFTDSRAFISYNLSWFFPFFEIIPDSALNDTEYGPVSRPTSITGGNYGIVGDNGQIVKIEDNSTIVNETNNTYYNPATGQTSGITDWNYDYSNRTYTLTLEGGKTSAITYGDESITITETTVNNTGDTITNNYTVYYVIGDTGTENPPAPHVHNFQLSGTTPASCTQSGQTSYACSCGETKSETLPALGHDWQIKQTVNTEYDDTGQLIQEGYTIYECSRCKEQYKAASGARPPSSPGFNSSGGIFAEIFGLLLDFLSFFWNTFKDFTSSGIKAFLSALSDGASDIFGLLNPFDWSA